MTFHDFDLRMQAYLNNDYKGGLEKRGIGSGIKDGGRGLK
jgi:hypothetical protein